MIGWGCIREIPMVAVTSFLTILELNETFLCDIGKQDVLEMVSGMILVVRGEFGIHTGIFFY